MCPCTHAGPWTFPRPLPEAWDPPPQLGNSPCCSLPSCWVLEHSSLGLLEAQHPRGAHPWPPGGFTQPPAPLTAPELLRKHLDLTSRRQSSESLLQQHPGWLPPALPPVAPRVTHPGSHPLPHPTSWLHCTPPLRGPPWPASEHVHSSWACPGSLPACTSLASRAALGAALRAWLRAPIPGGPCPLQAAAESSVPSSGSRAALSPNPHPAWPRSLLPRLCRGQGVGRAGGAARCLLSKVKGMHACMYAFIRSLIHASHMHKFTRSSAHGAKGLLLKPTHLFTHSHMQQSRGRLCTGPPDPYLNPLVHLFTHSLVHEFTRPSVQGAIWSLLNPSPGWSAGQRGGGAGGARARARLALPRPQSRAGWAGPRGRGLPGGGWAPRPARPGPGLASGWVRTRGRGGGGVGGGTRTTRRPAAPLFPAPLPGPGSPAP